MDGMMDGMMERRGDDRRGREDAMTMSVVCCTCCDIETWDDGPIPKMHESIKRNSEPKHDMRKGWMMVMWV